MKLSATKTGGFKQVLKNENKLEDNDAYYSFDCRKIQ